jgi:hypothetical protein
MPVGAKAGVEYEQLKSRKLKDCNTGPEQRKE